MQQTLLAALALLGIQNASSFTLRGRHHGFVGGRHGCRLAASSPPTTTTPEAAVESQEATSPPTKLLAVVSAPDSWAASEVLSACFPVTYGADPMPCLKRSSLR